MPLVHHLDTAGQPEAIPSALLLELRVMGATGEEVLERLLQVA
jgi:hypothetical protein